MEIEKNRAAISHKKTWAPLIEKISALALEKIRVDVPQRKLNLLKGADNRGLKKHAKIN